MFQSYPDGYLLFNYYVCIHLATTFSNPLHCTIISLHSLQYLEKPSALIDRVCVGFYKWFLALNFLVTYLTSVVGITVPPELEEMSDNKQ